MGVEVNVYLAKHLIFIAMKNKAPTLLLLLFGSMLISFQSCGNTQTKKTEYMNTIGDQSVELRILNDNDYLIYDTPTRVDFKWTNIDLESTNIGGAEIKILGTINEITQTEFTVTKEKLKMDTLHITIIFKKGHKRIPTVFHVPVRAKK
ncbi:MAG: hypothetical protein ACI86L_001771 [Dokdonia sp.]|jgi:hypothetical protein